MLTTANLKTVLAGGVALWAMTCAASAMAAVAGNQSPDKPVATVVGDLVVTANKRLEKVRDVALSVSAISGDNLVQTQTLDLQDIG